MRRLSIRTRITLGSVIVAAVVFTIALVAVGVQAAAVLEQSDATLARNDLTSFAVDIAANPDESVDDPGTGLLVLIQPPSGPAEVDTLPRALHELVEQRQPGDELEAETAGGDFIVVGRTVETPDGTWTLWAARSTESRELTLRSLAALLVVGGVLLLAAFGIASWFLASAALRPVVRLQRGAERLAEAGERASLPVGDADDEIARLATTLNSFLDDVRDSADREKRMVSDAAHELRTPLAALKTQLEIARQESTDSRLDAQLAAAETSVDRLSDLATNLLELARLEQRGDETLLSTPAELEQELLASVDRARLLALRRGVAVDYDIGALSASVGASARSFGRLCDNLLANAVTAAEKHVRVTLLQDSESLRLTVVDDGAGMPQDFVSQAFERFSRSDTARTSTGSGLGLSLVKAIAEAAGGTASVANGTSGLTARVTLPNM
jgi:two-component system OmpR family sensor kinase